MQTPRVDEVKERLEAGFIDYAKQDIEGALQLITGLFIGLNTAFVEIHADKGDSDKAIHIQGPEGQRKITIHESTPESNEE